MTKTADELKILDETLRRVKRPVKDAGKLLRIYRAALADFAAETEAAADLALDEGEKDGSWYLRQTAINVRERILDLDAEIKESADG